MKPQVASKKIFDFGAFIHRKWSARLGPGDSILSPRPLCSTGRRNGVGAAWLYCAASTSRFFRSAANFFNGFSHHIGGKRWFNKAEGWDMNSGPPPFKL
jgi:hypothetical protein